MLVIMQLSGVAMCCFPVGLKNMGSLYGLILCVLGAAFGITTLCYNKIGNFSVYPEPKPQAILITSGPYQYIRHPMYVSLVIMMIGIALYNFHWLNGLGLIIVTLAVIYKTTIEEKLLELHFSNYSKYQQKTKDLSRMSISN